jgi:choline-sulfatase
VGLYLKKLEAMGELENTVVVFSSDHGEMLGDHGRWGKSVPYHASACVPFLAAGPGIARGAKSAALISIMDLAATFLDYAGVTTPKDMDSRSFRALLEGKAAKHREVVLSGLGAWRMAFDGRYKVITGFPAKNLKINDEWTPVSKEVAGVKPMVFDLMSDPKENQDLFDAMPADAAKLLERLKASQAGQVG